MDSKTKKPRAVKRGRDPIEMPVGSFKRKKLTSPPQVAGEYKDVAE